MKSVKLHYLIVLSAGVALGAVFASGKLAPVPTLVPATQTAAAHNLPAVEIDYTSRAAETSPPTRSIQHQHMSHEEFDSFVAAHSATSTSATGGAQDARPNIVIIMGDDIGWFNIGAYHRGMMSGKTPNIDRLAREGMMFTDTMPRPVARPAAQILLPA